MDSFCKKIITNFFNTFNYNINLDNFTEYSNLLSIIKDNSSFEVKNSLQRIYKGDLIKASSLFDEEDKMQLYINDFLQGNIDKTNGDFLWFLKFVKYLTPYISFRQRINEVVITSKLSPSLEKDLKKIGWVISKDITSNTTYIIDENLKQKEFYPKIKNISSKELEKLLNPSSLFKFETKGWDKSIKDKGVIGFDIDGTIVSPSNILLPYVKDKINEIYIDGYNIVLISNQKRRKIGDPKLKLKFEKIADQLGVPFIGFAAREEDMFRKPNIGMYYMIPEYLGELKFYVGDAAGRPGDHSDDDIQLAKNLRVPFFTPEEFFNPFKILKRDEKPKITDKTLIILVGYPGSGKSTYAKNILKDFERVNRDELKTLEKCEKETERLLKEGKNVVIDNTNFKKAERKIFIDLANKYGYNTLGINIATTMEQSMKWNQEREKPVHVMAFLKLRKDFQPMSFDEGFEEIYKVL